MSERRTPSGNLRMPARMVAVFIGFLAYRAPGDEEVPAGIALGIGVIALAWAAIDAYLGAADEKGASRLAAQSLIGAAAIGLGFALW